MTMSITTVSASAGVTPSALWLGYPAQFAQKGGAGWLKVRTATLTGDTSYPSGTGGGYPVTASQFMLTILYGLDPVATSGTQVATPQFDYGNSTIRFYNAAGATSASECASGTNLSTVTWRVFAFGI